MRKKTNNSLSMYTKEGIVSFLLNSVFLLLLSDSLAVTGLAVGFRSYICFYLPVSPLA